MHGLLSILIWLPIAAGVIVLADGRPQHRARPLGGAAGIPGDACLSVPLWTGFDASTAALQFIEKLPWIVRFNAFYGLGIDGISLPLDRAHHLHDSAGGDRRLDGHREAPGAVLRRLPHHGRPDGRGVLGHRCAAVLLLLGSDADPDVPHHRHLGWPAPRLRHPQVLPVHLPRLGVHAGRAHLHVREGAAATRSPTCRRCR